MHGAPAVLQVINRICDACFSADGESTTVDAEFRATASGRAVLVYAPVESGIEPRRVKLSADGLTIKTYWKAVALSLHHPDLTSDCGQKQSRPTAAIERLHAELHDLSSTIEKLNPLKPMIRDAAENFIRKYYGPADRQ